MMSLTWVNEIDISKVLVNQKVTIGIDALPGKQLEGEVISVANIGQPMPKSDAKVFEIRVRVYGKVDDLKPAMTTSNIIHTGTWEDALYIPTETVFKNDSLQYVFIEKSGSLVKQVVDLGEENENYVIVRKGLEENDRILLSMPEDEDAIAFTGMDIYKEIKDRKLKKEIQEKEAVAKRKNGSQTIEDEIEQVSDNEINKAG
jgi:hypothetical protein